MLMFYTNISQLPENADEYFTHYHNLWFDPNSFVSTSDLENALVELRLAYKKYPERRIRIKDMAHVISSGVNGFKNKEKNKSEPSSFSETVKASLF